MKKIISALLSCLLLLCVGSTNVLADVEKTATISLDTSDWSYGSALPTLPHYSSDADENVKKITLSFVDGSGDNPNVITTGNLLSNYYLKVTYPGFTSNIVDSCNKVQVTINGTAHILNRGDSTNIFCYIPVTDFVKAYNVVQNNDASITISKNGNGVTGFDGVTIVKIHGSFEDYSLSIANNDFSINDDKSELTIHKEWVAQNMPFNRNYTISFGVSESNMISAGSLNINPMHYYDVDAGDGYVYRYGLYDLDWDNWFNVGASDNPVKTTSAGTYNLYFGIGVFPQDDESSAATSAASQTMFDEVTLGTPTLMSTLNNKISLNDVTTENNALGRKAKKISINYELGANGTTYLFVPYTVNNVTRTLSIKLMFNDAQPINITINVSANPLNAEGGTGIFESASKLTEVLKSIDPSYSPATSSGAARTINIKLTGTTSLDGINWGIGSGWNCDFNDYIIDGGIYDASGNLTGNITINGSISNNGYVGVGFKNFTLVGDTNKIAIKPVRGDISLDRCTIKNYKYGVYTSLSGGPDGNTYDITGLTASIKNSTFENCTTAIYLDNKENYTGILYPYWFEGNTFKNCTTAIKIVDIIDKSSTNMMKIINNHFINNTTDFEVTHSRKDKNVDEYYYFTNNFYGSDETTYRSASIYTSNLEGYSGAVNVCTSPSLMYPNSTNKYAIDKNGITGFKSGIEYTLNNTNAEISGARIVVYDPDKGTPLGIIELNDRGVN